MRHLLLQSKIFHRITESCSVASHPYLQVCHCLNIQYIESCYRNQHSAIGSDSNGSRTLDLGSLISYDDICSSDEYGRASTARAISLYAPKYHESISRGHMTRTPVYISVHYQSDVKSTHRYIPLVVRVFVLLTVLSIRSQNRGLPPQA